MDTPTRFCSSCGSKTTPGTSFCQACGAPADRIEPAPGAAGWWRRQKDWVKVTLLVAPLVVAGVVVGVVLGTSSDSGPQAEGDPQGGLIVGIMGNRQKAQDAQAKSLVRNSMTAIESAYVDLRTFDPAVLTAAELMMIEPTIGWTAVGSAASAFDARGCPAWENEVYYWGTANTYAVGSESELGRTFGVVVDKGAGGGNTFYIDGVAVDSW